ncbi:amino acid transporter [Neobacillus drentensis]|uniref:amino acid transporter n=1 Tax=Neobacillus drentensis TaxID=220684 RepID=UPI003000D28F
MNEENKPFNDVIDHFNKITGNATNPANAKISKLPKPLKFIGFFMIAFFSVAFILIMLLSLLK